MTENNNRGVLSGISEWLARIDQSLDEIEQKDSELKEDDSVAAAKDSNDATSHLQEQMLENDKSNDDSSVVTKEGTEDDHFISPAKNRQMERGTSFGSLASRMASEVDQGQCSPTGNSPRSSTSLSKNRQDILPDREDDGGEHCVDDDDDDDDASEDHSLVYSFEDPNPKMIHLERKDTASPLSMHSASHIFAGGGGDNIHINYSTGNNVKRRMQSTRFVPLPNELATLPKFGVEEEEEEDENNLSLSDENESSSNNSIQDVETWPSLEENSIDVINQRGIVHVHLQRCLNLPVPKDTSMYAQVRLLPWKGKVRTSTHITKRHRSKAEFSKVIFDNSETYQFMHASTSEDSPLPILSVEIFRCGSVGLFDHKLCSLMISMTPLLSEPTRSFHRNFELQFESGDDSLSFSRGMVKPQIALELIFAPMDVTPSITYNCEPINDEHSNTGSSAVTPIHHLFQRRSFILPAYCLVCNTLLVGIRQQGYRCETCGIDCCDDCLLQADLVVPCNGEKSKRIVAESFQRRWSINGLVEMIAPTAGKPTFTSSVQGMVDVRGDIVSSNYVGTLTIQFLHARIFPSPFPSDTTVETLLTTNSSLLPNEREAMMSIQGDYYLRFTDLSNPANADTNLRTETVYFTSRPKFNVTNMTIPIFHYGMEFKIDLINATNEHIVGTLFLTVQGIMTLVRDKKLSSPNQYYPLRALENKKIVKSEFDLITNATSSVITGIVELGIQFKENHANFTKLEVPQISRRPEDSFRVDLTQAHFSRVWRWMQDYRDFLKGYQDVVCWKNYLASFSWFTFFVYLTLYLDMEYVGLIPFLLLMIYMIRNFLKRKNEGYVKYWTHSEIRMREETKSAAVTSVHRPFAKVTIEVKEGRHIFTRELGIPGIPYATVSYVSEYFGDRARSDKLPFHYDVGHTETLGVTSHPVWKQSYLSEETLRLWLLLQNHDENSVPPRKSSIALTYPVLQQIKSSSTISWENSTDAFIIQIHNGLSHFLDDVIGEVVIGVGALSGHIGFEGWIPLGTIVKDYNSAKAYFENEGRLESTSIVDHTNDESEVGGSCVRNINDVAVENDMSAKDKAVEKETIEQPLNIRYLNVNPSIETSLKNEDQVDEEIEMHQPTNALSLNANPTIYIRCSIELPDFKSNRDNPNASDREISMLLVQELSHIEQLSVSTSGISNINSSIKRIRGMGTNAQWIQNSLGGFLDTIEKMRNLFTFIDQEKSMAVFAAIAAILFIFYVIRTRTIIFVVGMHIISFITTRIKSDETSDISGKNDAQQPTSILTNINNLIEALPTDEDLRRAYFWTSHQLGGCARDKMAKERRSSRLNLLWKAVWNGKLFMKVSKQDISPEAWEWQQIYAVLQGHRLIWWKSVADFDTSNMHEGYILFAGHSGVTGLSPLDMRQLEKDEQDRAFCIFGKGSREQQKITVLALSMEEKNTVIDLIINVMSDPKVD